VPARYVRRMLERVLALSGHRRFQQGVDAALAGGLLIASLADQLKAGTGSGWGGPGAVQIVLAFAISVPFLWRRNHAPVVVLIVAVASFVCVGLVEPRQAAFEPFLALVLAFYAVGAYTEERRALTTLLIAIPAGVLSGVIAASFGWSKTGNSLPTVVWVTVAWIVGRIIRSWRGRAVALEHANRILEEQRELQAQAAVAVERGRIARELHDVIAHNISMIVVQAGAAASVLQGEEPNVRAALEAIETTGRETVDEMRQLLGVLRRADDGQALAPQPGLGALGALVAQVREAGLPVDLQIEGTPSPLPPGLDLSAYRIAQEGLTNALKHAGAARAALTVTYARDTVEIEIRNDGAGGAGGVDGTGYGLVGMRERVTLWGGNLQVGPERGGWVVRASLPRGGGA
jgi:signal transduction histidine kinase